MDFKDQIKQLSERVTRLKDNINTEEATKTSLVLPFLQTLGYDVFDPFEVVPEFISDIGTKKGEKVDYAILKTGEDGKPEPVMLIECKHWKQSLTLHDNQLLRYFHVTKARFGILTNGIIYRFYTDLETPNKMDEKPFLEIDLLDLKESQAEELKKFSKPYFDVGQILNTASELKYMGALKNYIAQEFQNPSEWLIKYFAKGVYDGTITAKMYEYFSGLVKRSIAQTISEQFTDKLKIALTQEQQEVVSSPNEQVATAPEKNEPNIVTTAEELEGFYIVRSILRTQVPANRIVYRDAQSYFAILLDDNNRKTLCRLHFNGTKKYIGIMDESKRESRHEIQNLDDIFNFADQIKVTLAGFVSSNVKSE